MGLRGTFSLSKPTRPDLAAGWGRVLMPYALARKEPNASREWAWQWLFPQQNRWRDRESGTQGRHHLDLHACAQPWSAWGTKPSRHSVTRRTVGSRTREPRLTWSSVLEDPLQDKELQGMAHWMPQWFSEGNGRQALVLGTVQ
jgi:hypothetical protein